MSPARSWPDIFIAVSSAGSHRGIDRLVIGNSLRPPPRHPSSALAIPSKHGILSGSCGAGSWSCWYQHAVFLPIVTSYSFLM